MMPASGRCLRAGVNQRVAKGLSAEVLRREFLHAHEKSMEITVLKSCLGQVTVCLGSL